jgi:hypothetical protein
LTGKVLAFAAMSQSSLIYTIVNRAGFSRNVLNPPDLALELGAPGTLFTLKIFASFTVNSAYAHQHLVSAPINFSDYIANLKRFLDFVIF